jgi:hypothetical protein
VEYEHIEPVRGNDTDEIIIGASSWDGVARPRGTASPIR